MPGAWERGSRVPWVTADSRAFSGAPGTFAAPARPRGALGLRPHRARRPNSGNSANYALRNRGHCRANSSARNRGTTAIFARLLWKRKS